MPNGATPGRFVKDATDLDRMKEWARSAASHGDRTDAANAILDYGFAVDPDFFVVNPGVTEARKSWYMTRFVATFNRLQKKLATTPHPGTHT